MTPQKTPRPVPNSPLFHSVWLRLTMALFVLGTCIQCTEDRSLQIVNYVIDTDGDGVPDETEIAAGTDHTQACDPQQPADYDGYDPENTNWSDSDCDQDGVSNGSEIVNGTNPYLDEVSDSDGDGIPDGLESLSGSDPDNPCDPYRGPGYTGFDANNSQWAQADCDQDGVRNGEEWTAGSDPYEDDSEGTDSDGDGIKDEVETQNGTNLLDPCDPTQVPGYQGYDPQNANWMAADCDQDGVTNGEEHEAGSDPYLDNRIYPVPEFLPSLSELNLFEGDLAELKANPTVFPYEVTTPLFTDYARKIRSLSVPRGAYMAYAGDGLLSLPDGTILTETNYYLLDERNPALGRRILETRVLIKLAGSWSVGKYVWNAEQTDAFLNPGADVIPVSWIDTQGNTRNVNYKILANALCTQCHIHYGSVQPLGVKARQLNLSNDGVNQLDRLVELDLLVGAPHSSQIGVLPDWANTGSSLEERARAYLDVNCSHCHQPGGSYNTSYGDKFDLRYPTSLANSNIGEYKEEIENRMNSFIPSYFMPYLGTSVIHEEGVELINAYLDTLEK